MPFHILQFCTEKELVSLCRHDNDLANYVKYSIRLLFICITMRNDYLI